MTEGSTGESVHRHRAPGPPREVPCPVRRVSGGPDLHFFGYYLTTPWDAADRRMLAHRVAPIRRRPTPTDRAVVGFFEGPGAWRPVAETTAWNWQQGSMAQWIDEDRIAVNVRDGRRATAAIVDTRTGASRTLPRPVYSVDPGGGFSVTLEFGRLERMRPVCGYAGIVDPYAEESAPETDGVHLLELDSGSSRLVLSLADMAAARPEPSMVGAHHWFNHLLLDPTGRRFAGLHRWRRPGEAKRVDRLFVADVDGGSVVWIGDEGYASHFDWRDDRTLLVYMQEGGTKGYFLADAVSGRLERLEREGLDRNGHCSYSPDGAWILTDTYPDPTTSERALLLVHAATGAVVTVGRFRSDPALVDELRCDLHPRWNRAGNAVSIDSTHEGTRQMYVVDVSAVVGDPRPPHRGATT